MSKQELSPKQVWSCDERYPRNPGKCRNSHGCHCKEIATLLSQVRQKDEALQEARAVIYRFFKKGTRQPSIKFEEFGITKIIDAALSSTPQPDARDEILKRINADHFAVILSESGVTSDSISYIAVQLCEYLEGKRPL